LSVGGVSGAAPVPFQQTFASALLDLEEPIPHGLRVPAAADPRRRFAVHRNNMMAGLQQALAARFAAVAKIVGAECFNAVACAFVLAHPPRSPVLACYGDQFPDFIDAFAPVRDVAYLADVARIEAARTRAYHAADAVPVDADAFAALPTEAATTMRLELHPSVGIIRSAHPIVTIWAMNSGERALAPIENWRGEDALVARPHLEVEVRVLPPGGAEFLLALAAGRPLGYAAQCALSACPQFNLTDNLAGLIGCGLAGRIISPAADGRGPR
jgi:Putative DNA-binding domain